MLQILIELLLIGDISISRKGNKWLVQSIMKKDNKFIIEKSINFSLVEALKELLKKSYIKVSLSNNYENI